MLNVRLTLSNGNNSAIPFAKPMIWREQTDHLSDCVVVYSVRLNHCQEGQSEVKLYTFCWYANKVCYCYYYYM